MGMIRISARGEDAKRFDEAMKRAKSGLMEACDIWEDMKSSFTERSGGSYGERYSQRSSGGYDQRSGSPVMVSERDWEELQERRRRDSMGQYM